MFLNVVLGHKKDLTDCTDDGETRQGEPFHARSLLWLRLVLTFQKSAAKNCKIGQRFIVANATHGRRSPMNVPKGCLGRHKQDLTDCAENLDKENPSTRSLLWLQLVSIFQKSAAKSCKIGQRFIVANATHGPHSPMIVPSGCHCLGTQTRPDRLRGESIQGEPFHALTPLASDPCRLVRNHQPKFATSGSVSSLRMPRMDPTRR